MGSKKTRRYIPQDAAHTTHNGQAATFWQCPRCGAELRVYVEATEVRCSCGARMRPSGATPSPVKRKRSEALGVALYA